MRSLERGLAKPSQEKHCLMSSRLGLIGWTKTFLFCNTMQATFMKNMEKEKSTKKFLKIAAPPSRDNHC